MRLDAAPETTIATLASRSLGLGMEREPQIATVSRIVAQRGFHGKNEAILKQDEDKKHAAEPTMDGRFSSSLAQRRISASRAVARSSFGHGGLRPRRGAR
jgi:hypothetical protein